MVGFVNPTIYANPTAFNDITSGTNKGPGTKGFSAVKGWDPVTGLGTPNAGMLESVFWGCCEGEARVGEVRMRCLRRGYSGIDFLIGDL
jgi:hypothetical protein